MGCLARASTYSDCRRPMGFLYKAILLVRQSRGPWILLCQARVLGAGVRLQCGLLDEVGWDSVPGLEKPGFSFKFVEVSIKALRVGGEVVLDGWLR